ncbi:MarR family transcriptional regulator [Pseudonocardia kujensis]|uniref:MarR family winged helix-turn-helix transcriptional regulator n=1 Tax=Pseudonocardia kujensis TaxID=1128675 RepID=UPI001E637432|nr:MarR family transcriptional regulator [Pseudonocardia kujensis]MCE0763300.1 MarR family transcriptional regulator [Pseudonocardia kujensis]
MATRRLTDLQEDAWQGFLRTHERVWRSLEAGLAPLQVSLAEYDVLVAVDAAGEDGARMSDLAQRRLMTTGGFTRLADRLEKRGLIARRRSTADGRSTTAVMTTAGRTLLRRARRQHGADIRALFSDRLDEGQLRSLVEIWAALDPASDPLKGDDRTC